jgi:hypothetical protein
MPQNIMNQMQHYQADDGEHGITKARSDKERQEAQEVFPGIPIVRSNTPRPLSFVEMISSSGQLAAIQQGETTPSFPAKAPSAPPLPEELLEREEEIANVGTIAPQQPRPTEDAQEFLWLFEYGLEMDATILNSSERLNGSALPYGPAVLKGYMIMLGAQRIYGSNGPTIVAIVPTTHADAEVWGILYRVPRRLSEPTDAEASLLDTIHAAIAPQKFFSGIPVVVHEPYRNREILCLTYVASDVARQQLHLVSLSQWHSDNPFMQRLATIARRQKLPESYIGMYEASMTTQDDQFASSLRSHVLTTAEPVSTSRHAEQNTDPLPTFNDQVLSSTQTPPKTSLPAEISQTPLAQHWLVVFALYLVVLLLTVVAFALLQGSGMGDSIFTDHFTPFGVPWLIILTWALAT